SDLAGDPRSGVVVDGRNAFGPWALSAFDAALAGLEGVRIAELRADPLTGATTAVTEEPLLVCPGGIPFADLTPASCPRADDAGVRLERTVTTGADGATLTASDRFISTDARAHALELRYAHRQSGGPGAYRLGWEAGAGFRARAAGETPPSPPGRVSTVELRAEAADPLPGPANPLGAITFSTRPDALRFTGPSAFEAAFTRTVPAAGALQIVQRFAAATDAAALAGHVATAEAEAAASGPRVGFTSPTAAAGFSREYVLTGRAEAPGAIAALVVNGRPVRPAADGSFAVPMELSPGANPVSAEVTDAAGDRAATSATIAFSPPPASASYLRPVYRRGVVTLPVTCQALAGTSCVVRSTLSARFKRKIGRRARFKTVVLQRLQITVPAGTSTVARIRVGARNRALVRKYRRLRARLELVQDGVTTTAGKPARRWYGVTLK
ncbi:MAG: hypothetical protein MUF56_05690, partial [Solirubrobacteraceae bacterium]|nr:hypothetical protein [Solirubrobacteraceae bacterium]